MQMERRPPRDFVTPNYFDWLWIKFGSAFEVVQSECEATNWMCVNQAGKNHALKDSKP